MGKYIKSDYKTNKNINGSVYSLGQFSGEWKRWALIRWFLQVCSHAEDMCLTSIAHGERTVTQHPSEPKATLLKSLLTLIRRKSQAQPKYIWSEQFNPPWASFWGWPSYAVSHQPQSKAANPWRVSGTNCRSDSLGSEKWSRAANQSLKTPNTTRLQRMLPKPAFIKLDCRKHKIIRSCSSISY